MLFKDFIRRGESYSLTFQDLKSICRNDVHIIEFHTLDHMSNWQELFKYTPNVIIYWETESSSIGHFSALMLRDGGSTIEIFDSYGLSVKDCFKFARYDYRYSGGVNYLEMILSQSGKKIVTNYVKLQSDSSHINTCGRHAAMRLRFASMSSSDYVNFLKSSRANFDELVTIMTVMSSSFNVLR